MYAVFVSGGKQYRVKVGHSLKLEKLAVEPGSDIIFDQILMVANDGDIKVGAPYLSGVKVTATVVSQGRGEKIRIIKIKRRKNHRKQMGHRQYYTEVKITGIGA